MTDVFLAVLGIFALSWLDRQRGTPKIAEVIPKLPALLGMGYLCAFYVGHSFDWQTPIIMAAVWAAHGIGFGQPIGFALSGINQATLPNTPKGAEYEPWQVTKLLKQNPWAALAARGAIVGAATLFALDPVASFKIALAFGIAFPAASAIVRYVLKMPAVRADDHALAWARQEQIRGGLIGCILFAGWIA